tara:strand:+ start:30390 stop:30695 length:306 start_codon:yes stop_codon:yes gene_type:complete
MKIPKIIFDFKPFHPIPLHFAKSFIPRKEVHYSILNPVAEKATAFAQQKDTITVFYTKFKILPETNCITVRSLTFISSYSHKILVSVTEKVTAMALWEVSE